MPRIKPLNIPPSVFVITTLIGLGMGLGGFAFIYGRGHAYLTNDSRACVQCHVMQEQYDGWNRSTHRAATTCNSCHAPDNLVGKYVSKAINGFNHSVAFTTGKFSEPIRIKEWNLRIAESNCVRCHGNVHGAPPPARGGATPTISCTRCHNQVGHPH